MRSAFSLLALGGICAIAAPLRGNATRKFKFAGVNESGAEFGAQNVPGTLDQDYTWPLPASIDTLIGDGFNLFRIPILMERIVPNTITGTLDPAYLQGLQNIVSHITSKGAYAAIDPHNFGRYNDQIITDTASFQAFWKTVATPFANDTNVIFDTNNEYHDMDQDLVFKLNQAAIDGIRSAGAQSQIIFVEGNQYTGAWSWTTTNDNLKDLKDPANKIVYEMHQYLDADSSGTSDQCASPTVGAERIKDATDWLKKNGKQGFLGELAGGANDQCKQAVTGMLSSMGQNAEQWLGFAWWGGGPWWGDYIFAFEPPQSIAYDYYLSTLQAQM